MPFGGVAHGLRTWAGLSSLVYLVDFWCIDASAWPCGRHVPGMRAFNVILCQTLVFSSRRSDVLEYALLFCPVFLEIGGRLCRFLRIALVTL